MKHLLSRVIAYGALLAMIALTLLAQDAKDLYLKQCAVCHGADGAGKTAKGKKVNAKDVRETSKKVSVDEMIKVVQDGKGPNMNAYGKDLSQEQIKGVVDYYRSLAK